MPLTYTPRLSVAISAEDLSSLQKHLPRGYQKTIFNLIVKDLIKYLDRYGANLVVAAFLNQDINLIKMCRLEMKNDDSPKS